MHLRLALPIVLAAVAGGCGDSNSSSNCTTTTHDKFVITQDAAAADATFDFQSQRCRLDADACGDLCTAAESLHSISGTIDSCTVGFDDDGGVHFDITYEQFVGGLDCEVPGGIGFGGGEP